MAEDIQDVRVNVINPEGNVVSYPKLDLQEALDQGYQLASDEDVTKGIQKEKYGSTGQVAKGLLEEAAGTATLGASTFIQKKLGADPEDILGRKNYLEEEHPFLKGAAGAAGIAATALIPGYGAEVAGAKVLGAGAEAVKALEVAQAAKRSMNLYEAAGSGVSKALGLGGAEASTLSKIGSRAVNDAAQMALMTGSDEVSRALVDDPEQHAGSVLSNIGLSAALGGGIGAGFGAVSPLWEATAGKKLASVLSNLADKGGADSALSEAAQSAMGNVNVKAGKYVKGLMSGNSFERDQALKSLEGSTIFGRAANNEVIAYRDGLKEEILSAVGKKIDDIDRSISPYETGKEIGEKLGDSFEKRLAPLKEKYEGFRNKYAGVEIEPTRIESVADPALGGMSLKNITVPGTAVKIQDKIGKLAIDNDWSATPDLMRLARGASKSLKDQKTANDLIKFAENFKRDNWSNIDPAKTRAAQLIGREIEEEAQNLIQKNIGAKAPQLLDDYAATRAAWSQEAKLKDALDEVLKVKGSTSGYGKALKDAARTDGEMFARRLTTEKDVYTSNLIQENFPEVAEIIKNYKIGSLLKESLETVQGGETSINIKKFIKKIESVEKNSPEMLQKLFTPEQLQKFQSVDTLDRAIASRMNPSGTAKTSEALNKLAMGSAMGVITHALGLGPVISTVSGAMAGGVGAEVRDAIRAGVLKFVQHDSPVSAAGFKAMVDNISSAYKAQKLLNNGVKNIFKGSEIAIPNSLIPKQRDRDRLNKALDRIQEDPSKLMENGGSTWVYMPEHAAPMTQMIANSAQYLIGMKPDKTPKNPLDKVPVVSKAQEQQFNRALDIAEQPLLVLNYIKEGTLVPQDIQVLQNTNPPMYKKMQAKIQEELINAVDKKKPISYKTKMGLSMFLGQPLDSSMTPFAIQGTQAAFSLNAQAEQQGTPKMGAKHSFKDLDKMGKMSMTPQQSRMTNKLKG